VPLEARVHRDSLEGGQLRCQGSDQQGAGGLLVDGGVDPATPRTVAATLSVVSLEAVDGGSSGGRAPKAAWMTSTRPAASSADATDNASSKTVTFTDEQPSAQATWPTRAGGGVAASSPGRQWLPLCHPGCTQVVNVGSWSGAVS